MVANKILVNAALSDDELDQVAGGTRRETGDDGHELFKRGLIHNGRTPDEVNDVMHQIGYTGYQGINKAVGNNVYTDKSGNTITREEFWNNFDAENGTKILPRDQWKFR